LAPNKPLYCIADSRIKNHFAAATSRKRRTVMHYYKYSRVKGGGTGRRQQERRRSGGKLLSLLSPVTFRSNSYHWMKQFPYRRATTL
jgi:hypothetical protein